METNAVSSVDDVQHLMDAVLNTPHTITAEQVVLRFSPHQEGHNALVQLRKRLVAYALAAKQREQNLTHE